MYGIFTYIWLKFMVNVDKYTIHGSYGIITNEPPENPVFNTFVSRGVTLGVDFSRVPRSWGDSSRPQFGERQPKKNPVTLGNIFFPPKK